MFNWLWMPGRKAREALLAGRPEQARSVLEPYASAGHRKALALMGTVAKAFLTRAERALDADNPEMAWDDLLAAEAVAPADPGAVALRTTLTKLAAATCRAAFLAGNLTFVRNAITRYKERGAAHPIFDWIPPAVADWQAARELADQGDFTAALGLLDRIKSRLPVEAIDGLSVAREDLASRYDRARTAQQHLFEALERGEWREVHRWSEDLLAVAPEHAEARLRRSMAWDRITGLNGHANVAVTNVAVTKDWSSGMAIPAAPAPDFESHRQTVLLDRQVPVAPRRLFLSLDGVGGYLLLFKAQITIGADANPAPIDIPVTANLQRVHAEIARDSEGGYLIKPAPGAASSVNGEAVQDRRVLRSGDLIQLGSSCRFRFELPNPLSGTAVLTPQSLHRMAGHATGIVMVASTLLVGPGEEAHIPVPNAAEELIFYTTSDGIGVRTEGRIRVQSMEFHTNAVLPVPCQVETNDHRFRLEVYDPRS